MMPRSCKTGRRIREKDSFAPPRPPAGEERGRNPGPWTTAGPWMRSPSCRRWCSTAAGVSPSIDRVPDGLAAVQDVRGIRRDVDAIVLGAVRRIELDGDAVDRGAEVGERGKVAGRHVAEPRRRR